VQPARSARPPCRPRGRQGRVVRSGARPPARPFRPQHRRARQQPAAEARHARRRQLLDRDRARPRLSVRAGPRMRLRSLFWKLFLGFWLTLTAAGVAVGTAVWIYHQQREPRPEPALSAGPRAEILVRSAAATLRHGGEAALRDLLETEAGEAAQGARVHAVDDQDRELLGRPVPADAIARAREMAASAASAASAALATRTG